MTQLSLCGNCNKTHYISWSELGDCPEPPCKDFKYATKEQKKKKYGSLYLEPKL